MLCYPWRETERGIELFIRLTAKSSYNGVQGLYYDSKERAFLKIAVTAPARDGLANKALLTFLGDKLRCTPSSLALIKGHTERYKTILMTDFSLTVTVLQLKLLP